VRGLGFRGERRQGNGTKGYGAGLVAGAAATKASGDPNPKHDSLSKQ
jgi:hypothetical protein